MIFQYALITGVLSNLLHAAIWWILSLAFPGQFRVNSDVLVFLGVFATIVSLPAILIAVFLATRIVQHNSTVASRYFLWMGSVSFLLVLYIGVLFWLFNYHDVMAWFWLCVGSILAFWSVSAFRFRPFKRIATTADRNRHVPPDYSEFEKLKSSTHEYKP